MKDIEKTSKKECVKHNSRKTRALTTALALNLAACKTPTSKDLAEDSRKIEVTKQSIEHLIKSRKSLVKKYNELVRKSNADPDNIKLQESKAEVRDAIKEKEKQIEKLGKKYIKQTKKFDEDMIKSIDGTYGLNDELPEDAYDFMLGMIE